jgi:lambda repressor-like predicted transcriptional regulator
LLRAIFKNELLSMMSIIAIITTTMPNVVFPSRFDKIVYEVTIDLIIVTDKRISNNSF